jgi:hypothetical protein
VKANVSITKSGIYIQIDPCPKEIFDMFPSKREIIITKKPRQWSKVLAFTFKKIHIVIDLLYSEE